MHLNWTQKRTSFSLVCAEPRSRGLGWVGEGFHPILMQKTMSLEQGNRPSGSVNTMYITWNVAGTDPSSLPCSSEDEQLNMHLGIEGAVQHYLDKWRKLRPRCLDAWNAAWLTILRFVEGWQNKTRFNTDLPKMAFPSPISFRSSMSSHSEG